MKIEFLEKVMHGREVYEAGDVRTLDDVTGAFFCACGWAKDVAGDVATGERNEAHKVIAPDKSVLGHKAQEA